VLASAEQGDLISKHRRLAGAAVQEIFGAKGFRGVARGERLSDLNMTDLRFD
jgi:hypothetical protein